MIYFLTGLIGAYVIGRFVPALPWPVAAKWLMALALLAISQQYLLTRSLFGSLASPELPFGVLAFMGWLFGALLLLFFFLLFKDVGVFLFFVVRKLTGLPPIGLPAVYWTGILGVAALGLSAIGVWQAVRVPDVRDVEVRLERLPPQLDGLRIVQLTDLHASRLLGGDWQRAVVEKTNALKPDLILITGDLVDGTPENRAADVAPLRDLKARLGVLAIPGNHEYYSDFLAWKAAFDKLGLRVLQNEHVVLGEPDSALVVAGTTDRNAERFGLPLPDINRALTGAPKDAPVVLMAHQPKGAAGNAEAKVDLQLSGHTHGGQIAGLHWIVQAANEGFVSGLYRVGAMQLYVSNGTGLWNGFPVRIGRPSEITQITLRAAKSADK